MSPICHPDLSETLNCRSPSVSPQADLTGALNTHDKWRFLSTCSGDKQMANRPMSGVKGSIPYLCIFLMLHSWNRDKHNEDRSKDHGRQSLPELINSIIIKAAAELWQDKLSRQEPRCRRKRGGWPGRGGAARDESHAECNEESDVRAEMCSPWSASTTSKPREEIIVPFSLN